MSRNSFTQGEFDVTYGWDPPLGTFFLQVVDVQTDELVYEQGTTRQEVTDPSELIWPAYITKPDLADTIMACDQGREGDTWEQKSPAMRAFLEQLQQWV